VSDVDTAFTLLLQPVADLVLAWETVKVLEHPDELGFGWRNCIPLQLNSSSITVHEALAVPVLSYLLTVGEQRRELWRKGRDKLPPPTYDGAITSYSYGSGQSSILPFQLNVSSTRPAANDWCNDISAPPALVSYCEDILFAPLTEDGALGPAISTTDPHHFHTSMFSSALALYLTWSKFEDVEAKIQKLINHYAASGDKDYTAIVLNTEPVRSVLWQFPELCQRAETWLPAGNLSFVQSSIASATSATPIVFNPLALLPKPPYYLPSAVPTLLEARIYRVYSDDCFDDLFAPFVSGRYNANKLCLTFNARRRLAVSHHLC